MTQVSNIQEDETRLDLRRVKTPNPQSTGYRHYLWLAALALATLAAARQLLQLNETQAQLRTEIGRMTSEVTSFKEKVEKRKTAHALLAEARELAASGKRTQLQLVLAKLNELHQAEPDIALVAELERLRRIAEGWPATKDGLVFLWKPADGLGNLQPRGEAKIDADGSLDCTNGAFIIDSVNRLLMQRCTDSHQLTVETVIQSASANQSGPARIISFSTDGSSRNFTLGQDGPSLIMRLRTSITGTASNGHELTVGKTPVAQPTHIAITYSPGCLRCYSNGRQSFESDTVRGDFSNWVATHHFLLGDEYRDERDWHGRIARVAIYDRALTADEVALNYTAAQAK